MRLISVILLFASSAQTVFGQNSEMSLGSIQTDLERKVLELGLSIVPDINQLSIFMTGEAKTFSATPNIELVMGAEDAFSSIVGKVEVLHMIFKVTSIAGVEVVDTSKPFHVFSMAFGTEADQSLETVNGLLEVGYMPWYQNATNSSILSRTRIGLFIQGGNKFSQNVQIGGKEDQSQEQVDSGILRLKGSFIYDPIIRLSPVVNIKPNGEAHVWMDALNSEMYYRIKGAIGLAIGAYAWEFKYEKGSGAPNFNQGEQFGMGLKIIF